MNHFVIAKMEELHNWPLRWAHIGAQAAFMTCVRVKFSRRFELTKFDHSVDQMNLDVNGAYPGTSTAVDTWRHRIKRCNVFGYEEETVIVGKRGTV